MRVLLRTWPAFMPLLWLCAACLHPHGTSQPVGDDGDRILITEERIARSGALNAWEALKRLAPQFRYGEKRDGRPTSLERRGRSSILLDDAPRVFVDGTDVADFRSLTQIPASTILLIEILGAIEGTTYYGSNAVSGVILIRTKNGS
jgi:outer membrane cobalamin receptor